MLHSSVLADQHALFLQVSGRRWLPYGFHLYLSSNLAIDRDQIALQLGADVTGPLWVRCSFLVQSAKAEGAVSWHINMANGPFLLVNGESVLREAFVD